MSPENSKNTVKIIINGVALCYRKDALCKIVFPFDSCHQIKLTYQNDAGQEFEVGPLAKENRFIEIVSEGATSASGEDASFEQILNLTADFAHSSGIKLKDDWRQKAVLMEIQNAVFFMEDQVRTDFVLLENEKEKENVGRIGHSVRAEIELADNGTIRVLSDGAELFVTEKGTSYNLIFDNDCPVEDMSEDQNDFDMFYDIIQDAENPERRFEVTAKLPQSGERVQRVEIYTNLWFGKPCFSVRASDTANLP